MTATGGFVDIGNLVTSGITGARFGASLTWAIVVGVVGMTLYGETAGRVAAVARRPVFTVIRERLGVRASLVNLVAFAVRAAGRLGRPLARGVPEPHPVESSAPRRRQGGGAGRLARPAGRRPAARLDPRPHRRPDPGSVGMRAVDLFGVSVYDASGTRVGKVRDLYVEAGGEPLGESGDPAYRLVALECGSLGLAHRLGCGSREMAGPWPLGQILARLTRRSRVIAWGQIARITPERIDLAIDLGEPGRFREADL